MRTHSAIHPGVTLKEDFLEPMNLSATALAKHIHVAPNRVTRLINGEVAVTADTALRLEKAFGVSAQFWLNLQQQYDLIKALAQADKHKDITKLRAA